MFTVRAMPLGCVEGQRCDASEELIKSIEEIGMVHPIIVNDATGRVLDGRKRIGAAVLLGMENIRAVRWHGYTSAVWDDSAASVVELATAIQFAKYQQYSNQSICEFLKIHDTHFKAPSRTRRILQLDLRTQAMIAAGDVPASEAFVKSLMGLPEGERYQFARRFVDEGLTVVSLPKLVNKRKMSRLATRARHHSSPAMVLAFPPQDRPFDVEPQEAESVVIDICQMCEFRGGLWTKDAQKIAVCKSCPVMRGVKKWVADGMFRIVPDKKS